MKKILIIATIAISGLVGIFSLPKLIQGIKNKFYPMPKTEQPLIFDEEVNSDNGSNNKQDQKQNAEVKGESTVKTFGVTLDKPQEALLPSLTSAPVPTATQTPDKQQTTIYVPVPIYQSPSQTSTYNKAYWDEQIKQAEKEAEESRKAREAYDKLCSELMAQRNAAVAPIQAQMNEVLAEMDRQRAEIDNRTDLSESGKAVAKAKISGFDEWMDWQVEYNKVFAQYGSC